MWREQNTRKIYDFISACVNGKGEYKGGGGGILLAWLLVLVRLSPPISSLTPTTPDPSL